MEPPPVWQMVKEAVEKLNGQISYADIKKYIKNKWGNINPRTINTQIIALTVNHNSRIHYLSKHNLQIASPSSPYNLLYTTGRGRVVKYDLAKHGIWETYKETKNELRTKKTEGNATTNTFLFAWNPDKWEWATLEQSIEQLENSGKVTEKWSCASHKAIRPGDRAFLIRLGSEPRGILAAGYVTSEPFLSKHWSGENKEVYRVLIDFEVLLNPEKEPILTLDILRTGKLEKQQWTPQSSGISIKSELIEELEAVWFDFLTTQNIRLNPYAPTWDEENKIYTEGTANSIIQTRYERNPHARTACIQHYGYSCSVCQFDFEKCFGELGKNFIHVHHLTRITTVGNTHEVDPIKDLRPVCPNCHAMLHRQDPPLAIENLKAMLNMERSS